jgi:hypothetical protein
MVSPVRRPTFRYVNNVRQGGSFLSPKRPRIRTARKRAQQPSPDPVDNKLGHGESNTREDAPVASSSIIPAIPLKRRRRRLDESIYTPASGRHPADPDFGE